MVEPTGALHDVPVEQLFFSTTDAKGVIDLSNSVFTRLSRYSREQLRGAPHNIIRHPDMPAAAFYVMWATLHSGEPFAAYVRNLAADGSEYRVFATITPLPDGGYLSVRSRPCDDGLYAAASGIYDVTRAAERELIAAGKNRRAVAEGGVPVLVEELGKAGIKSYEDFQNAALVSEVQLRESQSEGFPTRAGESPLHMVLANAHRVYEQFGQWMTTQETLSGLAADIAQTVEHVDNDMAFMSTVGKKFTDYGADRPELATLTMPLTVWAQMQDIVGGYMSSLSYKLDQLKLNVARTQFRIALSRLHIFMYGQFVAELIDSPDEDLSEHVRAVVMLGQALSDDVVTMRHQLELTVKLLGEARTFVGNVVEAVAIPRQLLGLWESTAGMTITDDFGQDLAKTVATAKDHADASLQELADFGERLGNVGQLGNDSQVVDEQLHAMCDIVNSLEEK